MQKFTIEELKAHPRNNEFFDDMSGEKWNEFLESIKTSGVIEPIVVTQDKIIVSGHQRVRACKELGIEDIDANVKIYDSDDDIIKDLLETNIRQRGEVGGSTVKLGRRIKELERIYRIRQGSAGKGSNFGVNNVHSKISTQEDLAHQLGINLRTLQNAKTIANLPQEIQALVEHGSITPSTAARVISKLSDSEQAELIETLPAAKKYTQKEVEGYIEKLREKDNQIAGYELKMEKAEELKQRIGELEVQLEFQTKPIIKEVIPSDYDNLKKDSENLKSEIQILNKDNQKKTNELNELRTKLDLIEKEPIQYKVGKEIQNDCFFAVNKINRFIKETGGLAYLASEIDKLDDENKCSFTKAVQSLVAWGTNILNSINR